MNSRRHKYLAQAYQYRFELGFAGMVLVAAFFRLWHLGSVAPGLDGLEAAQALKALDVTQHPRQILHIFNNGIGGGLFTLLEALSIRVLGNTVEAARLVPAIGGIIGTLAIYVWMTSWFGKRAGLTAGFLVAVIPWFVTLARINTPAAFVPFGVAMTMWAATELLRRKTWWAAVITGFSVGLLLQGRSGWAVAIIMVVFGLRLIFSATNKKPLLGLLAAALVIAVLVAVPLAINTVRTHSGPILPQHPKQAALNGINVISDTALMFGWRGDSNFRYNLGGTPMLNLFVALMLIVGLLVSASRSRKKKYQVTLVIFLACIVVSALTTPDAPSSLGSFVAAPFGIALAVIGIEYMLDTWYSTFPINSAARTLGTLPIVLLLVITSYQGYKQYFIAWANSPEIYQAYNEQANGLAQYLNRTSFDGQRYALIQDQDANIVAYLTHKKSTYTQLKTNELTALPQTADKRQFLFIASPSQDTLAKLKAQYPKARLSQHYSAFNEANQLFAVYETQP